MLSHLTYLGRLVEEYKDSFGPELPYLPLLQGVTFRGCNLCDIPWTALQRCLSHPTITSITFSPENTFIGIYPHPEHDPSSLPLNITSFTYNPDIWRALDKNPYHLSRNAYADEFIWSDLVEPYTTEYLSLSPLILRMCEKVESLTLPIESAPLERMASLRWPQLRELCLSGQAPLRPISSLFRDLISGLPRLEVLSVRLATKSSQGRLSLLGHMQQCETSIKLRSLTLAFPDPCDAIFSVDSTSLTQLSICDHPRNYYLLGLSDVGRCWSAPVLSSAECLSVLRRMELPALHTLRLVYETDGDDDELLAYIANTFPRLMHLELHRYRKNRKQIVPHVRIYLIPGTCL